MALMCIFFSLRCKGEEAVFMYAFVVSSRRGISGVSDIRG